jgi:hypothetical protein
MPVKRDALSGFAALILIAAAMERRGARLGMMCTARRATKLMKTWLAEATGRMNNVLPDRRRVST